MINKLDLFNNKWCDLVFDNRNKQYGAYELRKEYAKNIVLGIFFAGCFSVFLATIPSLTTWLKGTIIEDLIPQVKNPTEIAPPPIFETPVPKAPLEKSTPRLKDAATFNITKDQQDVTNPESATEGLDNNNTGPVDDTNGSDPSNLGSSQPAGTLVLDDANDEPIMVAEEKPEFPGGIEMMYQYIAKNFSVPKDDISSNVRGTIYLSFVVGKDGRIRDTKILKGIGSDCDKEAIRVVNSMPTWKPGRQNGRNVSVSYTLPIKIKN